MGHNPAGVPGWIVNGRCAQRLVAPAQRADEGVVLARERHREVIHRPTESHGAQRVEWTSNRSRLPHSSRSPSREDRGIAAQLWGALFGLGDMGVRPCRSRVS